MRAGLHDQRAIGRKRALVAAQGVGDELRWRQIGVNGSTGEHVGAGKSDCGVGLDGHWTCSLERSCFKQGLIDWLRGY